MLYASFLLAQAAEKAEDAAPPAWGPLPMLAVIMALFYFLIFLPGRREKQQRQSMMSALKKNDKVITSGGIIGVVLSIKEGTDEVTIRSEDTKLLIQRSSIARIITDAPKEPTPQSKG